MRCKVFLFIAFLFFYQIHFSQNIESISTIPANLIENANSIVRNEEITIEIKSISNMIIRTKKTTSVFNEKGLRNIDADEKYNKSTSVNSIEAIVYNAAGKEIKKLKRKDFRDFNVGGDASDITDDRVLSLNYTPTEYPFTIVYESEVQTSNTAFIPRWYPVDDYNESVQKSTFLIAYPPDLGFKYKEVDFGDKKIIKQVNENSLRYVVENFAAEKLEDEAPVKPTHVLFGLDKFSLEGVQGNAKTWKDFGLWMNEKLLKGTNEISSETKEKIKILTQNESDPIKKAKIIYQYVQDKTRYVSIQLGIGGWKPMLAKDVDRLGYGDCKALSNYTKSLLEIAGVPSYYTIIYGGQNKMDILEDFVSMQGNHVVLAIPNNDKLTFLECTSQTQAFGFEGDFTDDRFALLIKPDGGELVKTNKYIDKDNAQITKAKFVVNEAGSVKMDATIQYTGIQYNRMTRSFDKLSVEKAKEECKKRWSNLNELSVVDIKRDNDKSKVQFTETLQLSAPNFVKSIGTEKMIVLNVLNQGVYIPKRYRNRKNNFEIEKGYYDEDIIEIEIPLIYKVSAKPEVVNLDTKFGTYHTEVSILDANKIQYKRSLLIKKGDYNVSDYETYRKFREEISKNDNSKIILESK